MMLSSNFLKIVGDGGSLPDLGEVIVVKVFFIVRLALAKKITSSFFLNRTDSGFLMRLFSFFEKVEKLCFISVIF